MATCDPDPYEEIQIIKEKNNELVQTAQRLKLLAGQRENDKIELMKEVNEMRIDMGRFRHSQTVLSRKLESAVQSRSEVVLNHLVKASEEVANIMDMIKVYNQESSQLETGLARRWSSIRGSPKNKNDKVQRVPPMMIGGQSIHPIVSISRTLLNTSNPRSTASPNQNRNVTERAMPMHMLQDVYIPLTRIDPSDLRGTNMEAANETDESNEDITTDNTSDGDDVVEDSHRITDSSHYNSLRRMDTVAEDIEPNDISETSPRTRTPDNPMEGPSWMLDLPSSSRKSVILQSRGNLEPDSTTPTQPAEAGPSSTSRNHSDLLQTTRACSVRVSCEFSPTVRRRKRSSSPAGSPRLTDLSPRPHKRASSNGRVLKVMVAKMRLDSLLRSPVTAPLEILDAPSPNGATVPGLIVSESLEEVRESDAAGEPASARVRRRLSQEEQGPSREGRRGRRRREPSSDDSEDLSILADSRSGDTRALSRESTQEVRERGAAGEPASARARRRPSQEEQGSSREGRRGRRRREPSSDDSEDRDNSSRDTRGLYRQEQPGSCEDDSSGDDPRELRTRRQRKVISYQEKPLNRKLRR